MNKRKLTPKQERFVDEYMVDLNGAAAARRAGYSEKTARQIGDENLAKPVIAAAIAAAKHARSEATKIDAEWVLKQAVELHLRCMQEIKPALHPKTRRQLKDEEGNLLFTFNAAAASRALELIGKHVDIGAFKDKLEISSGMSLVERLQQGRARVRKSRVIDGEFEHVEPVAPKALPKPKATKPRPRAMLVEIAPEPATKSSEDAVWEERTRGLPDGQWRDPQGLIRTRDGQVASRVHRDQERRKEGEAGLT